MRGLVFVKEGFQARRHGHDGSPFARARGPDYLARRAKKKQRREQKLGSSRSELNWMLLRLRAGGPRGDQEPKDFLGVTRCLFAPRRFARLALPPPRQAGAPDTFRLWPQCCVSATRSSRARRRRGGPARRLPRRPRLRARPKRRWKC